MKNVITAIIYLIPLIANSQPQPSVQAIKKDTIVKLSDPKTDLTSPMSTALTGTFQGTLEEARLKADGFSTVITTNYGGGIWSIDKLDTSSNDNTGTIFVTKRGVRYKRVYTGPVNVQWFKAKPDGITDNADYFDSAIAYCFKDVRHIKSLYFPTGDSMYKTSRTIVINYRDTSVKYNSSRFYMIGESAKGNAAANRNGVAIVKTTPGPIIRMCEEANGTYPGGGKHEVVNPLNFVRSIVLKNINFVGGAKITNVVSGFVGRGINNSIFEGNGFIGLDQGICLGKGTRDENPEISKIGNINLDYCERNYIVDNSFHAVDRQLFIQSPDITTIERNYFDNVNSISGYIFYWNSGNDRVRFISNIVHPRLNSNISIKIEQPIRFYNTTGAVFLDNHFEDIGTRLFCGTNIENLEFSGNTVIAADSIENVFRIVTKAKSNINIHDNTIVAPYIANFVEIYGIRDNAEHSIAKQIDLKYLDNKATTTKAGTTGINLTSNMSSYNGEYGQTYNPIRIGRYYLWVDSIGKLRLKNSEPLFSNDGDLLQSGSDTQDMTLKLKNSMINSNKGEKIPTVRCDSLMHIEPRKKTELNFGGHNIGIVTNSLTKDRTISIPDHDGEIQVNDLTAPIISFDSTSFLNIKTTGTNEMGYIEVKNISRSIRNFQVTITYRHPYSISSFPIVSTNNISRPAAISNADESSFSITVPSINSEEIIKVYYNVKGY